MYGVMNSLDRVLMTSNISAYLSFAFMPPTIVPSHNVTVLAFSGNNAFCVLQSRTHENWVTLTSSTLEERLGYRHSDCFETFPFPSGFETDLTLESAGGAYYKFRSELMVRNNEGLTKTYNRFHDPDERSPDIFKLRELHAAMDRAVLDAYGWIGLKPTCEFLLDYEEDEEDDDESGGGRRRKKPWRYRWPDEFRDDVLARLLELNRQRAEMERLGGVAAEKAKKPRKTGKKTLGSGQMGMF